MSDDVQINVIVDGMNIVYRCHYVYDVQQKLSTADGKPTGTIYGFARHMVKLRDRFPGANYYVVWEGKNSRKSRREVFADYKANRSKPSEGDGDEIIAFDQLEHIKDLLDRMGIHQAEAEGYEADDVIATLVRERFERDDNKNILVSSDRDLLQLVGSNTVLMTPQSEKFYDEYKVEEEYGVTPSLLLAYRTLDGDKSDNLPGMYRFPRKKIASIVNEHDGDLESIYTERKLDLTEFQTNTLEDFEEQAHINHQVMTMQMVEDYDFHEGDYDTDGIEDFCSEFEIESIRPDLLSFKAKTGFIKTG